MPLLERYFPPLTPDPKPATVAIAKLEDLEPVAWVRSWSVLPGFSGFGQVRTAGSRPLLVARFGERYSIVGFLDEPLDWLD